MYIYFDFINKVVLILKYSLKTRVTYEKSPERREQLMKIWKIIKSEGKEEK
jgi:hypothetical protein